MVFLIDILIVNADKINVELYKCVDGDTARFMIDGNDTKVRFLSIDAPETKKEDKDADPYGEDASSYTCERLTNAKAIYLEYDDNADTTDKYGRTLAWVWVDNDLLQASLIEKGLAKVRYTYDNYKYNDLLNEKEKEAQEKKLNIWSDYIPTEYTVTFDDGDKKTEIIVKENEKVESIIPKKDGYNFIGWMLDNKPFDFNNKINSDIILVAKYEKIVNYNDYIIVCVILLVIYILSTMIFRRKKK